MHSYAIRRSDPFMNARNARRRHRNRYIRSSSTGFNAMSPWLRYDNSQTQANAIWHYYYGSVNETPTNFKRLASKTFFGLSPHLDGTINNMLKHVKTMSNCRQFAFMRIFFFRNLFLRAKYNL